MDGKKPAIPTMQWQGRGEYPKYVLKKERRKNNERLDLKKEKSKMRF